MEKIVISWKPADGFMLETVACETLSPKQMLLLAMGKCAAMTAVALFAKMQLDIAMLRIETFGQLTQPEERSPSTFTSFHQHFMVECPNPAQRDKAHHAVDLTADKYCGVGMMLSRVAPVSFDIDVK